MISYLHIYVSHTSPSLALLSNYLPTSLYPLKQGLLPKSQGCQGQFLPWYSRDQGCQGQGLPGYPRDQGCQGQGLPGYPRGQGCQDWDRFCFWRLATDGTRIKTFKV